MIMRMVARGYLGDELVFRENITLDEEQLENVVADMALRHSAAMAADELDMIEFEFLDEPDPDQRFFRIGTNPDGMVMPIEVDL
jgi:hypothetical protein